MPANTGVGNMSIGKDIAVDVVLSTGSHLRLGVITMFDRKPKVAKLHSKGLDGVNRFTTIPEGWDLTFEVDRVDGIADLWWADYEKSYFAGSPIQNVTVTETISEGDGSISQYRYEGCSLHFNDAGSWKSDKYVNMKLAGEASFRKKIA